MLPTSLPSPTTYVPYQPRLTRRHALRSRSDGQHVDGAGGDAAATPHTASQGARDTYAHAAVTVRNRPTRPPRAQPQFQLAENRFCGPCSAGAVAVSDDPMERLEELRSEVKRNLSKAAENIEDPILKQAVQVCTRLPRTHRRYRTVCL